MGGGYIYGEYGIAGYGGKPGWEGGPEELAGVCRRGGSHLTGFESDNLKPGGTVVVEVHPFCFKKNELIVFLTSQRITYEKHTPSTKIMLCELVVASHQFDTGLTDMIIAFIIPFNFNDPL